MRVEEIALRQEIRQMMNEAGLNKNTIRKMASINSYAKKSSTHFSCGQKHKIRTTAGYNNNRNS